ncbi:hypothetical protein [Undibacterium flavidum]|uniref:FAD assembly factor SdhE n=1 Tax=Undibacterium flavidum TaxID=2762297 RepID=A0ABR6YBG3_9BURK|nr:hypothetical protein [Undibacterium flavidum]MBC3873973.1 hypothetical protein [Undibacterium flavidum]
MTNTLNDDVTVTLTSDEAVVLFEFLRRFSDTDKLTIEDQAEERVLWNLCCIFEKASVLPLEANYPQALLSARDRLRDEN